MTKIDQFESAFKSAAKTVFEHREVSIDSILTVTDLESSEAASFGSRVVEFLSDVRGGGGGKRVIDQEALTNIEDLLRTVKSESPDLICTYRALKSDAWRWGHSLGEYLDVLTQATTTPVLVLPHPNHESPFHTGEGKLDSIVAMTDHLVGDHRLVNYALRFTHRGGSLFLADVEDEAAFERYIGVISKIPSIDTETAREEILQKLLQEAEDYAKSVADVIAEKSIDVRVESTARLGHHLSDYRRIVSERAADLLVLNTKEEDQLAMHGLAYPLAVELNRVPLLML